MNQTPISNANETCKSLVNANRRVNDARRRLLILRNSGKKSDEIQKIIVVESNYLKKLIIDSLKEKASFHSDNKDVMRLWNILERSLLEFKNVYDRLGRK